MVWTDLTSGLAPELHDVAPMGLGCRVSGVAGDAERRRSVLPRRAWEQGKHQPRPHFSFPRSAWERVSCTLCVLVLGGGRGRGASWSGAGNRGRPHPGPLPEGEGDLIAHVANEPHFLGLAAGALPRWRRPARLLVNSAKRPSGESTMSCNSLSDPAGSNRLVFLAWPRWKV